jgi:sirohydrochlorin ferrochelatase
MQDTALTAVILIAHGSRRAEANDDVRQVARQLSSRGEYAAVEVAYLELAEPTIPDATQACVATGVQRVLLMPYFLSAGRHVVEDLQRHCRELSLAYPNVGFELCPPLGVHPLMLDFVRDRLHERLDDEKP